jgi:hypothetical protein
MGGSQFEDLDIWKEGMRIALQRTQIYLGYQLKYIDKKNYTDFLKKTKQLSTMIGSFIKARKTFNP